MIRLVLIVLLMGIIGFGLGLLIWPDVAVAKLLLWTGSAVLVVLLLLFALIYKAAHTLRPNTRPVSLEEIGGKD